MADEPFFTPLCSECSYMCYEVTPLWSWDEQAIDSLLASCSSHELHSQISHFYHRFRERLPAQNRIRDSAVSRVIRSIQLLWPSSQVLVYGSYATGLYLPSSDIDLLVLNSGCGDTLYALDTLKDHLFCESNIRVCIFRNARVPIVRFCERESMIQFDVRVECGSMNNPLTELQAVQMMIDSLTELPAMGPLYVLLKTFLDERRLNVAFPHGGVRLYMLFVMLKTFLHHADELMPMPYESPLLTVRLLGFLHFYGISFVSERYGISCRQAEGFRGKGFFFSKEREVHPSCGYCPIVEHQGFHNPALPYLLAVEDPLKPSNDLGRFARRYLEIQDAFREAYADLISPTSELLHSFIPYSFTDDDEDLVSPISRLRTC